MSKQGLVRDGSENALNVWVRGVVNPILTAQNKPLALNVGALKNGKQGGMYEIMPLPSVPF